MCSFPGCWCLPGSGINTHHRDSWREEHPHQMQEGTERDQEGHMGKNHEDWLAKLGFRLKKSRL